MAAVSTNPNLMPPAAPPPLPPDIAGEDPVWTFMDVVRIAVLALVASLVLGTVAAAIALGVLGLTPAQVAHEPRVVLPVQSAAYAVVVLFMYFVVRARAPNFWRAIRWKWPHTGIGFVAAGVALALAVMMAGAVLPMPRSVPFDLFFRDPTGAWLMAIFGTAVAPFVEEMFFRGFLYPVLARSLGMVASIVLTSLGFALLHQGQLAHAWVPLLLLFFVGVVLTTARARTGSVAPGWFMHVSYNATLLAVLYVQSDHFRRLAWPSN